MLLELKRNVFTASSTIGDLYVDGTFQCHTLENAIRSHKIDSCTAIPAGTYAVTLQLWPARASNYPLNTPSGPSRPPLYPLLLNVPNFSGIFIHCGNFPTTPTRSGDTHGCLLVGKIKGTDMIQQSRAAFQELFPILNAATDEIRITIS